MRKSTGASGCRKRDTVRRAAITAVALLTSVAPLAQAMTLQEALSIAVRTYPSIKAVQDAARSTHEEVPLALSAWLPTVRAGISTDIAREKKIIDLGRLEDPRQERMELSYTQNLYRSGHSVAKYRQAIRGVSQSHALVEDKEQTLLLRVATVYLDVLRSRRVVRLREASMAAFDERLRETEAQFEIGDRTRADVAQAVAEQQISAADVARARADLEIQKALFEQLVGMPADNLKAVDMPDGLPTTLEMALRVTRDEQPAVRAAEHAVRAAEHSVRAASAELGPQVDLIGSVSETTFRDTTVGGTAYPLLPDSTDLAVELRLSVPLYQAGGAGARLRQAVSVLGQRRDERLAALREAKQQTTNVWLSLISDRQREQAFQVAAKASREALLGIRREAAIGERTIREVLDAERQLVLSQIRVLTAERDVIVSAYRLLKAVGRLTARQLGIAGIPDLASEARDTQWDVLPGIFSLGREPLH